MSDAQASLFDGTPVADGWHYVEFRGTRFRWKHDARTHANPSAGLTIETHRPAYDRWTEVKSGSAVDWFAVGFLAAGGTLT